MPHFKVDDGLDSHPKAQRAGDEAMGMWVRAGAWSMRYLTDGFIPAWWVKQQPRGAAKAKRLVDSGFWHPADKGGEKGWQFHEFVGPGRQDSAEQIRSDREKWRRKKAAQRESLGQSSEMSPGVSPGDMLGEIRSCDADLKQNRCQNSQSTGQFTGRNGNSGLDLSDPVDNASSCGFAALSPGDTSGESPGESRVLPIPNTHIEIPTQVSNSAGLSDARGGDGGRSATPGAELVRRIIPANYPSATRTELRLQANSLLHEGQPVDIVEAALRLWIEKPGVGPRILPSLVADVLKGPAAQSSPANGKPHKMRALAELTQELAEQETRNRKELHA